jgi:hypothetical protein
VIIRRLSSSQQLITQPAHAALAERIMRSWSTTHFPESPRKASILNAVAQHDCGWAVADQTLVLGETTGELLDFREVPDAIQRDTSIRGLDPLASDPYAAALAAQHRLHVYRRHAGRPEWDTFFDSMRSARDSFLHAAGGNSLEELFRDYWFVRAGDLASLAFCNNWADTPDDGCGYAFHLDGTSLTIVPDPLGGRTLEIEIAARVIQNRQFATSADARRALAAAQTVTLTGQVRGASRT